MTGLDLRIDELFQFLVLGGIALWAIAALSILTLALILWKIWHLTRLGVWSGRGTDAALEHWRRGDADAAMRSAGASGSATLRIALGAMAALRDPMLDADTAREETVRLARREMTTARSGLRALELIATIAPLLGLFGTVLGMISAFQALQASGAQADAADLAGGIWEALLTTAAGMGVAIPSSVALAWFESIAERLEAGAEDIATRIFLRAPRHIDLAKAAE